MTTPNRKAGFTLVELAVALLIVGILAGLALPNLHQAILKADAAHIASDAHTVQLAAYAYLNDHGSFPSPGPMGAVPPQLKSYLPEHFAFGYKGAKYWWIGFTLPNDNNVWKSRTIGLFVVNYSAQRDLAEPMKTYAGPDAYWSTTMFYYLYAG